MIAAIAIIGDATIKIGITDTSPKTPKPHRALVKNRKRKWKSNGSVRVRPNGSVLHPLLNNIKLQANIVRVEKKEHQSTPLRQCLLSDVAGALPAGGSGAPASVFLRFAHVTGFSFLCSQRASREVLATFSILKRTPGISPTA